MTSLMRPCSFRSKVTLTSSPTLSDSVHVPAPGGFPRLRIASGRYPDLDGVKQQQLLLVDELQ